MAGSYQLLGSRCAIWWYYILLSRMIYNAQPIGTIDAPLGTVWVNDLEENFKSYHKEMAVRELNSTSKVDIQTC